MSATRDQWAVRIAHDAALLAAAKLAAPPVPPATDQPTTGKAA
jgi:hypothetical protein